MSIIDHETGEVLADVDLEILTRPFSIAAVKQREGGGDKIFSYVSTDTVIRRLNEATHNCWSFRIIHEAMRFLDGGIRTDKYNKDHPEQVMMVLGELTIPGLGSRQGFGVQRLPNPIVNVDDLLKAAAGDALKRAAVSFGVAIDLYGSDLDSESADAPGTDRAGRMASIAHGPAPIHRGVPEAPERPNAPTRPVNATASPESTREYPYEKVFAANTNMQQVREYLAECNLSGNNMGECIKAVNVYAKEVHGVTEDVVIGSGAWDDQYKQYKVYPSDIGNALAHYVKQESLEGVPEMQAAMARDEDDIPF